MKGWCSPPARNRLTPAHDTTQASYPLAAAEIEYPLLLLRHYGIRRSSSFASIGEHRKHLGDGSIGVEITYSTNRIVGTGGGFSSQTLCTTGFHRYQYGRAHH